jgi:hypothetical protein
VLSRLLPDWTADELAAFAAQLARFNADVNANRGNVALTTIGTESR